MKNETRTFRMNNKLLYDVITRQAGTIEKAWLEIVQNAIDAGATKVNFTINKDKFIAEDNGKGMNKNEILTYFEEFGNSSKKDSDLGEFGMGRGQIFAQGQTVWTTQNFRMLVDVKENGLDYNILEESTKLTGTKIEVKLYNNIKFLEKKLERFKEMIKFVDIDVIVNTQSIVESYSPTVEIKEGSIILTDNDKFQVYNRGIFVKEEYFGNGAIIISKKNLKVNFARNDIFDDCKIYNTLLERTQELIANNLANKQTLTQDDRKSIILLIRENTKFVDIFKDKKVIQTANNNFMSIDDIKHSNTVYFSDGKNQYEDDLLIEKGYTVLKNILPIRGLLNSLGAIRQTGNYEELVQDFRYVTQKEVDESELDDDERLNLEQIKVLNHKILGVKVREIKIAKNMVANATTDGLREITIAFKHVKNFNINYITYLLFHEYSHDDNTMNTDEHGYEFYQKFYELIQKNYELLNEMYEN